MSAEAKTETRGFETEVAKLLHLMVHSLYSNQEIFLRELISNASDASDKLRFEALSQPALLEEDPELKIRIDIDEGAQTVTITDNGIGMSRDEVIQNLGTIARSGTSAFMDQLTGDQKKDSQMIGQFGVGFYSAFIVADQVDVFSRRAGLDASEGVHWSSDGQGEYSIADVSRTERGTKIVLHVREASNEFVNEQRLRGIVTRYADHIALPVEMLEVVAPAAEGEDPKTPEYEAINKASALWVRSRSEVSAEEYQQFYQHVSHDFREPLTWSHNSVEGKLEYTSLLYIPSHAPFDLYNRDTPKGLKLYVQRVFILDDAEQFLPLYLRFIKGVVDSNDLPLNVSRELLQDNAQVRSIRTALTKRVLDMLTKMAKKDEEKYATFWSTFGQVLKEGVAEDFANQAKLAELFRFASTHNSDAGQNVALAQYVERMKDGQDKIYYISADSYKAASQSPHLEALKKHGFEVLLFSDQIDEWMMSYLREFDGKQLVDITKGDLDLGELDEGQKAEQEKAAEEAAPLLKRITDVLGDRVADVRVSTRLTDSPACLVRAMDDMGAQMRQIMEAAGQAMPESKAHFDINPSHALVMQLDQESDEDRFSDVAEVLFAQAQLAEGVELDDPMGYVQRVNALLLK